MKQGKFITIEGVEGVGKSTQLEFLQEHLRSLNIDFILTREPGGTFYSEQIRNVLLKINEESLDPVAELLLIFAARAQHLGKLIKPTLAKGTWVICDRFTDATYAYQGAGRNLGRELVAQLETLVQGELRPDLTLILDLDPEIGLQRATERGELDRFETEQLDFFNRVRAAYLELAASASERYRVINAGRDVAAVRSELVASVDDWLKGQPSR
ncbi:MAG: dTMP kinase [Pseudohongiellaceae bacterium]|jgi:dTMP kinase